MMMAFICLTAMIPASGMTAFATSGSDLSGAPVITEQPVDANIVCGQNAVFTVKAEGENLSYQWYYASGSNPYALANGLEFRGTDTASLTVVSTKEYYTSFPGIFNGTWSDTYFSGDKYYCVVTNANGSVTTETVVFNAAHNEDGDQSCDLNEHWGSCTCSLSANIIPERHAHTYTSGVCTVCGISETAPRLAGGDRCETAALISSSAYESAENVVIASGNDYADALAGVSLAYALDAPILLLRGSNADDATIKEIARLGAENIYILGGTVAVSQDYEDEFEDDGYNVTRIAGATRFDTCLAIAETLAELSGAPEEIFFAYSHNYPDALAISGIAAVKGSPVLYVASSGELTEGIAKYVSESGAEKATILGGEIAIGPAVVENIKACGIEDGNVQRLFGATRYDTNILINIVYADVMTGDAICVATGTNYPDALAGGVLSAINKAPIVLAGTSLNDLQKSYLSDSSASSVYVLGGTIAVSDEMVGQITDLLK